MVHSRLSYDNWANYLKLFYAKLCESKKDLLLQLLLFALILHREVKLELGRKFFL